jgi:L-ribulose-5-phosphate 4-epimerase
MEGYVKFNCEIIEGQVKKEDVEELNDWRKKLFELNLIGCYENGIGFGNISIRKGNDFIITGTSTGNKKELDENDYVIVKECDFEKNYVKCEGKIKASSETLTHAAIYKASKKVNAVIHIHNTRLWKELMNKKPTTRNVEYGTIEMTKEIFRLFENMNDNVIVMKGHEEGIIVFGKTLEEAGQKIIQIYEKVIG